MQNTVELPYPPHELDPDKKCCWRVKSKVSINYRKEVFALCKEAEIFNPGDKKINLSIDIYPPTKTTLDQTNSIVMIKYALKAIAKYLRMNDRNFIFHWVYHGFNVDFKGKVVVEIIPEPDL